MKVLKVGIIDYGLGNIGSIKHLFRQLGHRPFHSNIEKDLRKADLIILPGVGSFPKAMANIKSLELDTFIKNINQKIPIIGICLGMQILFTSSSEGGSIIKGLDILKGKVVRIPNNYFHIGWNKVDCLTMPECNNRVFYFNHSFAVESSKYSQGTTEIKFKKNYVFSSIVIKGLTIGVQFHPEKSQEAGIHLMQNIIKDI